MDTCVESGVRFGVFALAKVVPIEKQKAKKNAQIHYGTLILLIFKLDIEFDAELVLVLRDLCRANPTRRELRLRTV